MIQRTALACEISLARLSPQSTAASCVRREFKRHLFVVDSLDEQMQNAEREGAHSPASAGVGGAFFYLCGEY